MPYIQYLGPSDELDMRPVMGKKSKFHFFARDGILGPLAERGVAVEVTEEEAEELRTYPGHQFGDVAPPPAAPPVAPETAVGAAPTPPVVDPTHPESTPVTEVVTAG